METARTFCRNCSAACSMEIDVEHGRLIRARPDGEVSPYGAYLCPKGLASVEFHNGAENRLLHCLARGVDGEFAPIEAEAALDAIGAKLAALVAEHGPRSVAVYHGTGAYRSTLGALMERAWVAALGTPNFFSTMTIDQSAKWVTMARMGTFASGRHALRDLDVALLAGGNPLVTHQGAPFALVESGAPGRALEAARARGMKLILVDPRRTETARYADLLIQPLPGHDAALFAAIAHVLLRDGGYDTAFVERWCAGLGEVRAIVAAATPEWVAARADVPAEQIEQAARWLGEARNVGVGSGTGPSFSAHSNLADHMIELVNVLCGGYRRAGDRVRNPGTLRPRAFYEMAVPPTRGFEQAPQCVSAPTGQLLGEFPSALLPGEITADSPDRIRALLVFGGDPLKAVGDPAVASAAFAQLDLLVSLDSRMNETGKRAHYVVAASQPFERHDLTIAADALYPEPFAQYAPPIAPKPEGCVHDWEFFWALSARMNLPLTFKYWSYGQRFEDITRGLPLSLTEKPDPEALCRFLCGESAVEFDQLVAHPEGLRPDTPTSFVQPAPNAGGKLQLMPDDVAAEFRAYADERANESYPLQLVCRRTLHTLNGAFRESRGARKRYPVNPAWMNPLDMAALGLAEDALVEIASPHGTIRSLARGEDRLRRGVVSMSHMFGPLVGTGYPLADGGANTGELTSLVDGLASVNYMPRFSGIPVRVTPV
ncbi:anaerobic selenocysteine-containing dehydrogenase [Novosphingobium sp. PhB165]|uniref:molybdopterin-containing oxidoreductase family protein n=1 Tax=Novosphingobium sp. PhB165 TaxID=2485105 RepID=UPI001051825C|nr:molybdopterin-dependent oxidoreductase [Novosphingobium sp. PhB165]TCM15709.1 anaerobic selenocysteine-containing dehydrogenase [Novosphingobium sp. PhB165]